MTLLKQLQQLALLAATATAAPWNATDTGEDDDNGCPWLGLAAAKDFWFRPTAFPVPNRLDRPNNTLPSNDLLSNITLTTQAFRNGADASFIAAARNLLTPENLALLTAALQAPIAPAGWVAVGDRLPNQEDGAMPGPSLKLYMYSVEFGVEEGFYNSYTEMWVTNPTATFGKRYIRLNVTHYQMDAGAPTAPFDAK